MHQIEYMMIKKTNRLTKIGELGNRVGIDKSY